MKEIRCPECGYRLKENECPICMTKVAIPDVVIKAAQKTASQPEYRPARPATTFQKTSRNRRKTGKMPAFLKAIIIMFFILMVGVPLLFFAVDQIFFDSLRSEDYFEEPYSYETDTELTAGLPTVASREIYRDDNFIIQVDSYGLYNGLQAVEFTIANNTDHNVIVTTDAVAVNDYMLYNSFLFCELEAGTTQKAYLQLDADDLAESGIETVMEIVSAFRIYDSEDYTTYKEDVRLSIQTDAIGLEQPVDDSGRLVFEENGVRLIFREAKMNSLGDITVHFFVENQNGYSVNIGSDAVYLNDQLTEDMLWFRLWPLTRAIDRMYVFDASDYGIDSLEDLKTVALDLYIQNGETWEEEPLTVTFPISE